MNRYAVCPGSYDPITKGHRDLILRARDLFGEVEVLVMNNHKKTYRFTPQERLSFVQATFRDEAGVRIKFQEGMLCEYLMGKNAVLVKGIRNAEDLQWERLQADYNYRHCGVETVYLDAKEEFRQLSSTLVREKMDENGDLCDYLTEEVVKLLRTKL